MRVYLLSTHEEDGALGVRATLNRDHVMPMLESYLELWKDAPTYCAQCRAELARVLAADELIYESAHTLGCGWGGLQVHIVELE